MSDVRDELSQRVRRLRKEAKLTQAKLAEAASICAHYAGQKSYRTKGHFRFK